MKTTMNTTTTQTTTRPTKSKQNQVTFIWNNRWFVAAKAVAAVVFLGRMAE